MQVRNIVATDAKSAFKIATDLLGEDAVIMETKDHPEGIEVLAGISPSLGRAGILAPGKKKAFFANRDVFGNAEKMSEKEFDSRVFDTAEVEKPTPNSAENYIKAPKIALKRSSVGDETSQLDIVCSEVRELRRLVDKHFLETKLSGGAAHSEIVEVLKTKGFHDAIIGFIDNEIGDADSKESAWLALAKYFRDKLRVDQQRLDDSRTLCVSGDPGSGKTTLIAQLAARSRVHRPRQRIAFVSTDNGKPGASEQLRSFARILDMPVYEPRPNESPSDLIGRLDASLKVFVDMPSNVSKAVTLAEELNESLCHAGGCFVLTALPGILHSESLLSSIERHGPLTDGVALTRLDDMIIPGPLFSAVLKADKPVCILADSSDLLDGIRSADRKALGELLFEETRPYDGLVEEGA